jgi:molybdenum cofactor cytidylyltransferase
MIPRRSALILAAGTSRRMGRDKAGLPWLNGDELLPWLVKTLAATGWEPVAVVNPETEIHWRQRLDPDRICVNPRAAEGKTTSLAAGLSALPHPSGPVLITAVDQPRPPELYRRLAASAGIETILVPNQAGRRGHPVVVPERFRAELGALTEETLGLRGFLNRHRPETRFLECPPDWLRWDLNTPETHAEALAWFRAQSQS